MTHLEEKECCECRGLGKALCWLALSNAILISIALIVLGFGEIWSTVVVVSAIVVLIIGLIFAVITLFLIAKFVFHCLKKKKHHD